MDEVFPWNFPDLIADGTTSSFHFLRGSEMTVKAPNGAWSSSHMLENMFPATKQLHEQPKKNTCRLGNGIHDPYKVQDSHMFLTVC